MTISLPILQSMKAVYFGFNPQQFEIWHKVEI